MEINGVPIEDTFAEAFGMHMNRTIITAYSEEWARITAAETTGFGTSVIMAPAEAGIEYIMSPDETPDGRPGVRVVFAVGSKKKLEPQLLARLGHQKICMRLGRKLLCLVTDFRRRKDRLTEGSSGSFHE
ncbi:MAG: hypothetical protein ACXAAN_06820 [Candidatus Thorarchaeota archaeon]|jgi:formylmethanofuran--tetrahydromethanopterin N-formyltransferase